MVVKWRRKRPYIWGYLGRMVVNVIECYVGNLILLYWNIRHRHFAEMRGAFLRLREGDAVC